MADLQALYTEKFNTGIEMLAQQMMAETLSTVTVSDETGSKREYFDQAGIVRMQKKTGRAVNIPVVETPFARRAIDKSDYYMRDFVDEMEKLNTLNDPTNSITETQASAAAREIDKIVIDNALGTAFTGEKGETPVALPAGQIIVNGGTGFTLTKLKEGVRRLKTANAIRKGMMDEIHCLWTAKQEDEFINTTEVKSSDFNTTKVLTVGGVDEFYKVKFHLIEDITDSDLDRMLPKASTIRSTLLYVKSGVRLNFWRRPNGRVAWIDEREAWQARTVLSAGATRMQETKVVQIDVVEN